jgi:hypothetical protein
LTYVKEVRLQEVRIKLFLSEWNLVGANGEDFKSTELVNKELIAGELGIDYINQ